MIVSPHGWKLVLAAFLVGTILCGVCARAPRQSVASAELRRLVLAAVALYAVGAFASLAGHGALAGLLYGGGIVICSLAVWLSRGIDADDPPGGGPGDEDPPTDEPPVGGPAPDGFPVFDWDEFERDLADYTRERSPNAS